MREILFRGKGLYSDYWYQGYYVRLHDHKGNVSHRIYPGYAETDFGDFYPDWYEVDPETVGQYTELTDKNGKKIFEGDIVRTQPFSDRPYSKKAKFKQHIGVVECHINHFKNNLYEQDYEANWRVNIKDYGGYGCCAWSAFFKCEVIGNIHDNPELLKEG